MKLSKKAWIIGSSAIIGLIADVITVSDGYPKMFLGFWAGFLLFVPLFLFLFLKVIEKARIKNVAFITILSMILFIGIMILTFLLMDIRQGPGSPSDMYGLVYIIGFFPALILGLIYGLIIAFNLEK